MEDVNAQLLSSESGIPFLLLLVCDAIDGNDISDVYGKVRALL